VNSPRKYPRRREQAAALIIVLALVVLSTGLTVAYFTRTTADRPVANSSFNQATVDQLAQSAMDNVIGDLRQEITNGSAPPSPTPNDSTSPFPFSLYVPTSAPNMVPVRSPAPDTAPAIPNLIRRSVFNDQIPSPARASRASAVNSKADVSANGRSVTLARWNSHYLIPKLNTTDAGSDPITTGFSGPNFWAPDWVYVNNNGVTQIAGADNSVIGRYAYMIYDEGGLLDMNAAGYPSPTPVNSSDNSYSLLQYGRKGSLAFADLSGLPGLSSASTINNIIGWRNYASAQPSGTFPSFSFSTTSANTYYNFILSDPNYIKLPNFLINQNPALAYSPIFFLTTAWQVPLQNTTTQTDQAFTTRQALLKLRSSLSPGGDIGFVNALQYLGTSSREALASAPQWSPATADSVNPNFQTLLVTSSFTRNGGSTAYVGDYLVNKRFLLQRLNWLTYKGPSATVANGGTRNAVPTSAPSITGCIPVATTCAPDYDLWLLTRPNGITFGLTSTFLQDPVIGGTATNILKYFGLAWDAANERWNYVGHNGSGTPIDSIATFGVGGTQAATRDPDFFELLQAGILNGSLGDSFSPDPALPSVHQQSKMLHILTIGANLIAQSRVDSYPVRIACTVNVDGTPRVMEAVGIPRLPYVNSLAACAVGVTQSPGGVNWFLIPNLWDPYRDTWDLPEAHASNGTNQNNPDNVWLTPGYLRPPVRIRIQGSVAFGSIPACRVGDPCSPPIVSGSAQSGVVTFPGTTISNIDSNLSLVTGATLNNWHGRDGFLEAMRLRTNDISTSVTQVVPTNSFAIRQEWNSLPFTNMTQVGPGGNQRWIAYRVSLPGGNVDPGAFSPPQNPVLILQPGFQVTMEYQSPNGSWYPYSFLQGNNESNTTWIGRTTPASNLNLVTDYSIYAPTGAPPFPSIVNSSDSVTATPWATATLFDAPMFAKADPRSIRYNSQIGVLNITGPPMTDASVGIVGTLWPHAYSALTPTPTPPAFWTMTSPGPTPSPNPNPALYSQTTGDDAADGGNPYDESYGTLRTTPTPNPNPYRPVMMNRPFRSVGEMGYAFRDQPFRTLSFSSTNSPDAGLLDLFTTVAYGVTPTPSPSPSISPSYPTPTATPRGGVISLNSLDAPALAAVLASTIARGYTPWERSGAPPGPSPTPITLTSSTANTVATNLVSSATSAPLVNRAGLVNWIANLPSGLGPSTPKTEREAVVRALGEVGQTRTWNLMLDVIAQSGRYPPNATSLQNGFVVGGEQRYWVHVAIDRFTGQVIDKQIEVVNE
jgi:hypothetical protein